MKKKNEIYEILSEDIKFATKELPEDDFKDSFYIHPNVEKKTSMEIKFFGEFLESLIKSKKIWLDHHRENKSFSVLELGMDAQSPNGLQINKNIGDQQFSYNIKITNKWNQHRPTVDIVYKLVSVLHKGKFDDFRNKPQTESQLKQNLKNQIKESLLQKL